MGQRLRIAAVAAALLALAGCETTPQERRADRPDAAYFSARSARAVAACIAERWEPQLRQRNFDAPDFRPIQNGWTVVLYARSQGMIGSFVDVKDTPGGSSSAVFLSRLDGIVIDLRTIAAACQ